MPDATERALLEARLADLAGHLEWPAPRDAAGAAVARAVARAAARAAASQRVHRPLRPLVLAAAALAMLVAALLAVPGTRRALAELFGLGGVVVRQVATTVPATGPSAPLDLGAETTLADARNRAPFAVVVPASLGLPDHVYVDGPADRPVVSLTYAPRPGLPASPATDVGLLVTELPGRVGPLLEKMVGAGQAERLTVGGRPALWVEGPHTLLYLDRQGSVRADESRLAASTLVVDWFSTTVRLEGAFDRATAVALAEALVAVAG